MNYLPFIRSLYVRDKDGRQVPFEPNWAQMEVLRVVQDDWDNGRPTRIICLKARQLGLCLDPKTRVLTADLRLVPIEDLHVGQELVAVDEMPVGGRGCGRKMRTGRVEAKREVYEEAFRLTMDNGEELIATAEHRFMSRLRSATTTFWRQVKKMQVGDTIRVVTQPWSERTGYEDGWFAGMIDGEGSLRQKSRAGVEVCVSQRPGPVFDRALAYLKDRGYSLRQELDLREKGTSSKFGSDPVAKVVLSRMGELFRLMGQTRPTRFIENRWWEGKDLPGKKVGAAWSKVVAIEPLGPRRMVDLQTSTKTFIAEGFVSHNSTISEAILFGMAGTRENINCAVTAHTNESTEYLFGISKFFYETWRFKDLNPARYSSKRLLHLDFQGSTLGVATAGKDGAGRGKTYHGHHASECAFYTDPQPLMLGFNQAIPDAPGTFQLIESTANGVGNWFEQQWTDAQVSKANQYTTLFFPWWKHYEYIPCRGKGCHDGTCETCQKHASGVQPKDADERFLLRHGCTLAHIAWRRWAIANRCFGSIDLFRQEMPATAEEAFLSTGVNAFPEEYLRQVFEPVKRFAVGNLIESPGGNIEFVPDPTGPLRWYKQPKLGEDYFVGADSCYGTQDGDFAAAQVLNRRTMEQVAVWHGKANPWDFGDELMKLGRFYNTAIVSPETGGGGIGTISTLLDRGYPRVWQARHPDHQRGQDRSQVLHGFTTNYRSKQWAVTKLAELVQKGHITLHDPKTYEEMKAYVFFGGDGWSEKWGPADKKEGHDDLVMALAIAVVCEASESPLDDYLVETKRKGPRFAREEKVAAAWE